ncbi:permease [Paenibacillus macquariensis subsp. defensor]|nr:permease [Paenibacillus macquariensis subsp. defensor]
MKPISDYWKYSSMLLFGIGVSNIGSWIYFIALNLMVLDITKSPLAVSGLYIMKPLATIFTNLWSGSLIDRLNKRNLMVFLDIFRAVIITLLPLSSSIWYMYTLVILISMAGSVFGPTSMTYITQLIPEEQRPRFNSLNTLINSGAFLLGPAIAGALFVVSSPVLAIYLNAIALFISGVITLLMPNLESQTTHGKSETQQRISLALLKKDWDMVIQFYRHNGYVRAIIFLFGSTMWVMASPVDSLEASFATLVIGMSESKYGVLVSIAGAGIIVGAIVNTVIVKKLTMTLMIGMGSIGVCCGYMIYAFSHSFLYAAVGFFTLAFWLAFVNTGFTTFYQSNVPVYVMGRIGSLNDFISAILIIITTVFLGVAAEFLSIQIAVITGVIVMFLLGIMLSVCVLIPQSRCRASLNKV